MRIIRGSHQGRKIIAPNNLPVRPTTDYAKEGLFNIINNYFHFDAISVLDLFSGTGNISYEFAARGAREVVAVEINPSCTDFINKTAQMLSFEKLSVMKLDVASFLDRTRQQFNIIFADPPYECQEYNTIVNLVFDRNLLLPNGFLIIEHSRHENFQAHPKFYQQRIYGKVNFSIFAENI
ncbi:MAG: 16S rRNA (guanine(966)-N(2))-methyltransferase RsmD [Bacteroidales bacterium]|jgi:16S rRNA (guanine(966)-N(2))-methyltransferase RsmD|nr:16S rRNA (guanine(966)-N(2))-methyltransferase RsmD [Bacteroidales bacterium]